MHREFKTLMELSLEMIFTCRCKAHCHACNEQKLAAFRQPRGSALVRLLCYLLLNGIKINKVWLVIGETETLWEILEIENLVCKYLDRQFLWLDNIKTK